ncbi:hypothetical protein CDL15_Pgr013632 [Punica granatum]|uniref:Oxidoreductase-like domain-containing protein n=1 Tax=Punica granatum TaxID=22663 RepID=A0A218W0Y3_PUNGR|nr:hypothetical protein CDL15_Pgr013632 [Punica granatum]
METAQRHIPHLLQPTNHRRPQNRPKNVLTTAGASMARVGGGLALKGRSLASVSSIIARRRIQDPNIPFCATGSRSADPNVEEAGNKGDGGAEDAATADAVTLPPPPERPLPGDCCGSGCVRCVWDVYHEELQAYETLLDKVKPKD